MQSVPKITSAGSLSNFDIMTESIVRFTMKPRFSHTKTMSPDLKESKIGFCKRGSFVSEDCKTPQMLALETIANDLPIMVDHVQMSQNPQFFYETLVQYPSMALKILNFKNPALAPLIAYALKRSGTRVLGDQALFAAILAHPNLVDFTTRLSRAHTGADLRISSFYHTTRTSTHNLVLDDLKDLADHCTQLTNDAITKLWRFLRIHSNSLIPYDPFRAQIILEERQLIPRAAARSSSLHGDSGPVPDMITKSYIHTLNDMTNTIIKDIFVEIMKRGNLHALEELFQTQDFFVRAFPKVSDFYQVMASDREFSIIVLESKGLESIVSNLVADVFSLASKKHHGNFALFRWMLQQPRFVDWQNAYYPRSGYIMGFRDLEMIRYDVSKDAVREVMKFLIQNKQQIKNGPPHHTIPFVDYWIKKMHQYLPSETRDYNKISLLKSELMGRPMRSRGHA